MVATSPSRRQDGGTVVDRRPDGAFGIGPDGGFTTGSESSARAVEPPPRPTSVRVTRQGDLLAAALASSPEFRSAQDLHAQLRTEGHRIGLTTVYRHLQVLAERGEVDVLRGEDGETAYRRCVTRVHHHHLVCRVCGRTVEVADSGVEAWTERVAAAAGFSDVQHTVEISGTCASCAAAVDDGPYGGSPVDAET